MTGNFPRFPHVVYFWAGLQCCGHMSIECPIAFRPLSDEAFESIDRVVMACAYAAQNRLGRLCDERVYENDVAARLRAEGLEQVLTQVPLTVSFRNFNKGYRLDLVVNEMLYELKVADSFAPAHDAQCYHYAALLRLGRIKLLNFRTPSVEGRLRRCPFARDDNRSTVVNRRRWQPLSARCEALASDAEACLHEWGGFLDSHLFEEALIFFNGGEPGCVRRLPVVRDGLALGHHRAFLHAEDVAFVVTSIGGDANAHERQLHQMLKVLPLRGWQWMNICRTEMHLVTVTR